MVFRIQISADPFILGKVNAMQMQSTQYFSDASINVLWLNAAALCSHTRPHRRTNLPA